MNWSEATLGDLIQKHGGLIQTGPFGSQLKQSEYTEEGVPVVMPKDIVDGRIDKSTVAFISESKADKLLRHKVKLETIIFPRRGEITKRAYVRKAQEGWICGTGCLKIQSPVKVLSPKFLYYYMGTFDAIEWLQKNAVGSTMLNLSAEILKRFPVKFPSLLNQKHIASILSAYDDLIENNRRRITLLERSAQLLYREWFVHFRFSGHETATFVDGLPDGWKIKSIGDIATTFRGKSYKSSELRENSGQPFINLKCFERSGGFRISGLKWFFGKHKEQHDVQSGEILIAVTDLTRDAAVVAQAARVPKTVGKNAIYSMDIVKVVPKENIDSLWLYGLLRFSRFSAEVCKEATGTNVLHLKPKYIEQWANPIPPKSLRNLFSQRLQPVFEQIDNLEMQIQELTKARDLLLPRLMDGRISVNR